MRRGFQTAEIGSPSETVNSSPNLVKPTRIVAELRGDPPADMTFQGQVLPRRSGGDERGSVVWFPQKFLVSRPRYGC